MAMQARSSTIARVVLLLFLTVGGSLVPGFAATQFDTYGDGFWSIVNRADGGSLVVGTGGAGEARPTTPDAEKQFELLYNLQNATFRLRQRATWRCIGPSTEIIVSGGAVVLLPTYTGTTAQQWRFVDLGGGYFRIVTAMGGSALQSDGASPAHVTLVGATTDPRQQWRFVYQTHYPKKGTGGYEADYAKFGASWSYNWGRDTGASLPSSVVFEPMQWGPWWPDLNTLQQSYPAWHATPKPIYLLGFNEPDHSDQANMSVATAISLWPQLQAMNVPLVSPACASAFGGWLGDFYGQVASKGYRVDYTAVHWYENPDASGLINHLQSVFNTWGRPIWLTEFSTVDWGGGATWTEEDNYRFLAEFLWRAEDLVWLKRYAIFPFSGQPSANPWDRIGQRGDTFLADGTTFTPFGELYSKWDADRTLRARTPYLIQNLATNHRLAVTVGNSAPGALSIRHGEAAVQWGLEAAATSGRFYIVSMKDGRRLRVNGAALSLMPPGTTGVFVEFSFNGPDGSGYYFIDNLASNRSLRMDRQNDAQGAPTKLTLSMEVAGHPSDNTRWRFLKPYAPVVPGPVTGPTLTDSRYDGRSFSVAVPAVPGVVYYLDRRDAVGSPAWATVDSRSVATATTIRLTNQPATGPAGFYRVRVDW